MVASFRLASEWRTFWLDLGWLVVLVVTLAVPFVFDRFGILTYASSLTFSCIPKSGKSCL